MDQDSRPPRSEVDVAIVGAGAAGIAAGRRLAGAGITFSVLEARRRLGGRAYTVADGMPFPFDLGCGWLHSADRNPWARIAETMGFTIERTPPPWSQEARDLSLTAEERRDFHSASERYYERLSRASADKLDRPAADFLEPGCRWNPLLNAVSTYANGAELDQISVHDVAHYDDTGVNWRVVEGLGSAIVMAGADLPVSLDCAITAIDISGRQVRLETGRGVLLARAVIVTVPPVLLATGAIQITPELPDKLEAAAGLPLGLADKVVLAVDQAEALPAETRLFGNTAREGTGSYHLRPFGRAVIEAYFGGRLARDLEREGEGALASFAVEELVSQLGSDWRSRLRPVAESGWSRDPYAQGSYSHALPGFAGARAQLASPVEDRLFFAGEACSPGSFSTAHGAYETGVAAAEAILATLARSAVQTG